MPDDITGMGAAPPTASAPANPARLPVPARTRRDADERAFLPAALEILDTPPSPLGRAVGWTIMAAFAGAVAWAAVGEVDVMAVAPGRIIPVERSKLLQAAETSVVRAILVRDGDRVAAGQVLAELEPTEFAAERDRLAAEVAAAQLEIRRLRASLAALGPSGPLAMT